MTNLRERLLMDPGWCFYLGDLRTGPAINHADTYGAVKAGKAGGPAAPGFDDGAWRALDLPHDFVLEQPFDPAGNVSHGFKNGAVGWYRKSFDLPAEDLGKRLWIEFDGVFRNCTVWLNGYILGRHESGYTSFCFDLTDAANYGGRNVLVVRVDATEFEGWWYEGGGIYRHVWLSKMTPVHVGHWGVFASPELNDDLSAANVNLTTTVVNDGDAEAAATITSTVIGPDGQTIGSATSEHALPAGASAEVAQVVAVASPVLWDITNPAMYRVVTTVTCGDVSDTVETPFGIRHIRFDPSAGFMLNGRVVKLYGTCNHQDHAGVGIAVPDAVQRYRIARLQAMGSNAYRCAHNPPAAELLDACDEMGMLVMDESRHLSSAPWNMADLESMIRRDRNHPCIIMWSMANEEPAQSTEEGTRIVRSMIAFTKRLDPTRPTITAMHGNWGGPFSLAHDLQGCNYSFGNFDEYHQSHPEHPILGSEQSSALTTRGIYLTDAAQGYMSAYDVNAPDWGALAEAAWKPIADRPFMAGTFIWTGFDYRGEPTPYEWPCVSSHFGIMDTCGYPKDNFFYYRARWSGETVLHLLPHWTWPGREGEAIPVWAHTNCEEVELFLNGQSLGRRTLEPNSHLEWEVPYEPGVLLAKGYNGGAEVATATVEATGPARQLRLTPHVPTVAADGEDVCVITCSIHDAEGRVMPIADDHVTFSVSDNASILGVGNGDPTAKEDDRANHRRAFNGLCQALVQSRRGQAGTITVTATAPGLLPATLEVEARAVAPRPYMP